MLSFAFFQQGSAEAGGDELSPGLVVVSAQHLWRIHLELVKETLVQGLKGTGGAGVNPGQLAQRFDVAIIFV